ncbi:efflux RND transporter permease subunit [Rosistilla oblonga]|uniref:efflux RND transporter permease subunit n=1 Tax=Rosistilla oblonga TaxID=2527990 RepID=UPI003A9809C5
MLSNLFYRNRRLLCLAVGLIFVAGLSSYSVLPRAEDPELTPRFAIVNTVVPGFNATRVEALVTERVEQAIREIDEVKEITSSSRAGVSTIGIELNANVYAVDEVWSRVRDKIDAVAHELPAGTLDPVFEKVKIKANAMLVGITWQRDGDPNYSLMRRLAKQLKEQLERIAGTESVDLYGAPDEEFLVTVKPEELAALKLTASDIADQLARSDAKVSAGQLRGASSDLLMGIDNELDSERRIAGMPIRTSDDGPVVQLGDVAEIQRDVVRPLTNVAVIDRLDAVVLGIRVRSEYQIGPWNRDVTGRLAEFESSLPPGIGIDKLFDQNDYVDKRLAGLGQNLLLGCLAVFLITFLMMGLRNALVVSFSLPLSSMMVLAGMRLLEIPIHQISITGLIISLGLLIDNAIVVVDETSHRIRAGSAPADAVAAAVKHLLVPLFGSTLTTALSFAPIAIMRGPDGEFVGAIGVSVILAIASSFLLAVTIIPALAAMGRVRPDRSAWFAWVDRGLAIKPLAAAYRSLLQMSFAVPALGIALGLVAPILGFLMVGSLPIQFFPPADRDQVYIDLELNAHASIHNTRDTARRLTETLTAHPAVDAVHWFLGESAPTFYYNVVRSRRNLPSYGQAIVKLRTDVATPEIIHDLQALVDNRCPFARVLVRQLEQGAGFDAPVEVRVLGPDLDQLRRLGTEFRDLLVSTPGVIHSRVQLDEAVPKVAFSIDEAEARIAGLSHEAIANQLQTTLEGSTGGAVVETTEQLPVRVRAGNQRRSSMSEIASINLLASQPGRSGSSIPISAIATIGLEADSAEIPRLDGQRMNEIQGFIPAGMLPSTVIDDFKRRIARANIQLPTGYSISFGGEEKTRNTAVDNLMASVVVIVVMMVAAMVLTFGSFRLAALIFVVAGLSFGISHLAVWISGYPFGFMAIVGSMGLVGVAINDSIVVLAAIRQDPAARTGDHDALVDVVMRSTRHVTATTLTTIAGFTPLFLAGGGFWPPLAITIAGGVGGATLIALFFVPAVYVLIAAAQEQPEISPSIHAT